MFITDSYDSFDEKEVVGLRSTSKFPSGEIRYCALATIKTGADFELTEADYRKLFMLLCGNSEPK